MTEPIRVKQFDRDWLASASPADISEAFHTGALAAVLGGEAPIDVAAVVKTGEQLSREDVATMSPEAIVEAHKTGLLDGVLGRRK